MEFRASGVDLPLSGHDAYAFSPTTLVVADGVGSWSQRGVDPAIWSHMLVSEIALTVDSVVDEEELLDGLRTAVARCRAAGSSTLTMVAINGPDTALAYNLGDSSWWHIRDGSIIGRSTEMLHGPNRPFQVGRDLDMSMVSDHVDDGETRLLELVLGDRIVLVSDGLTKLLDPSDLAAIVQDEDPAIAASLLMEIMTDLRNGSYVHLRDDITALVAEVVQ